jgi:arsenate reductase (glutaredoxin)
MDEITIYQKPTCSKCRETMEILRAKGIDFNSINYFIDPIPKGTIKTLLEKLKLHPLDLFRKKEPKFKELGLHEGEFSEEQLIDILTEYPELIERPIVVKGDRAVVARPPERVHELFA